MLKGKNILLGISGGIAAYKCANLIRLLVKEGANVKVVATKAALEFITPQTISVLSKNEVLTDFFDNNHNWNNHVKLSEWANYFIIAPATANTIAKMAHGLCDNLLLAAYLSYKEKQNVLICPAMDLEMYNHQTVVNNIAILKEKGYQLLDAEYGELASGLIGQGRMKEPEQIIASLIKHIQTHLKFINQHVIITAGPTYEAIDPVRYIGNRSSGKMGIALAEAFAAEGAKVTLVLGPTHESVKNNTITVINVESSEQMYNAFMQLIKNATIIICAAAVADYKPETTANQKIKKTKNNLELNLIKTHDILLECGKIKSKNQLLIGFALETENCIENAKEKLTRKNADLIILNTSSSKGEGFNYDTNKISIIDKHNKITNFELKSKTEVANDILNYILTN
ncbi:MAG: bifunctional phosphopantothenoylcysteine decarboxylase/phosphopantothenate--cysteine ligase CoaBC [Bacteroidetes bacterium]|nr:bifunctional phosphopantothenoylcysteine decarboxylase/phosphopantothenate--cysteine ligase CoaBC [Bacteroidota bacterium]